MKIVKKNCTLKKGKHINVLRTIIQRSHAQLSMEGHKDQTSKIINKATGIVDIYVPRTEKEKGRKETYRLLRIFSSFDLMSIIKSKH